MRRYLYALILLLALLPVLASAQDIPPQVQKALDDLNARLGLSLKPEDVTWQLHQKVFDDASMGCPQAGATYYQGKTIGYSVELDVQGDRWDYRVSPDLRVTLCNSDMKITPTGTANTPRDANSNRAFPTSPPPPASNSVSVICKGAPPSRFKRDTTARLLPNMTTIVRIYEFPNFPHAVNEIQPGDVIKVLDGPVCSGAKTWWMIVDLNNYAEGWVSENEGQTYLFEVLDPSRVNIESLLPTPFSTPSVTTCAGAPRSRLMSGYQARVLPGTVTHVYGTYNQRSSAKYDLSAGRVVHVIQGPYCESNVAWWGILDYQTSYQGWIVENEGTAYLFEPLTTPENALTANPSPTMPFYQMSTVIAPTPDLVGGPTPTPRPN